MGRPIAGEPAGAEFARGKIKLRSSVRAPRDKTQVMFMVKAPVAARRGMRKDGRPMRFAWRQLRRATTCHSRLTAGRGID